MKVLLFALSASSVAAFAPNAFGVRCTFLVRVLLLDQRSDVPLVGDAAAGRDS
jgi:hypothetical protein